MMKVSRFLIPVVVALAPAIAFAESPYQTPTKDGRERLQRQGSCPSGYVGLGSKCEALHQDTPRAYPKIKGAPCPSGTFASGDYCKAFR
jgi:hypothetical protein